MSDDSDTSEFFRAMTADKKARHAKWHGDNRTVIDESKLPYTDRGEALLFRIDGKPDVDFYPSTGRWRDVRTGKMRSGGAYRFLAWLDGQGVRR